MERRYGTGPRSESDMSQSRFIPQGQSLEQQMENYWEGNIRDGKDFGEIDLECSY